MKKLIISFLLVNFLAACGVIHTPFDSPAPKKDAAATTPVSEPAKVDAAATPPEVNAAPINPPPAPETTATADAPKAEATTTADATPKVEAAPVAEPAPKVEASEADPLNDPASALSKRSVHFPFDVDAIQESDKATITAHGSYLAGHADRKIRVEGNTDERGSSEYNLALGQRRANNTKKSLVLAGAKATQIEAISYGEEKPLASGHDEASWAQNRRADIVYK
jgi:peptidoglycan-associated lipoprotein